MLRETGAIRRPLDRVKADVSDAADVRVRDLARERDLGA